MAVKHSVDPEVHAESNGEPPAKRRIAEKDYHIHFAKDLFERKARYITEYSSSTPYKHGVIANLIDSTLLNNVRDEIRTNLSFTPKETDIYRIHQSGDLANLDGLDDGALKLLPSLLSLRDALYSAPFREYLSAITESGPLSGRKTDMAVNVYTPGCHLLCHDDVIGSRRVSYILYLTDPDTPWKPEWGGALRLYPTKFYKDENGNQALVPGYEHTVSIPPAFNQLSFFAVQPGQSYHDVEEVYARSADDPEDDSGRVRMAISGWYHIPQEGEDGYIADAEDAQAEQSSLAQLQGKADAFELPKPQWRDHTENIGPDPEHQEDTDLTETDLNYLLEFMNPRYLVPDTVLALAQQFAETSSLHLTLFLSERFSALLKTHLTSLDHLPAPKTWTVARPPHKHRFLYLQPHPTPENPDPLTALLCRFFPSHAFTKWLALATDLSLGAASILVRRFRRGVDYALATSYDAPQPRLEVCLGVTPSGGWGADDGDESTATARPAEEGVGGYEVYMAGEDDGPAATSSTGGASATGAGMRRKADPAVYRSGEEDDGVLFAMPAAWNALSVVLRDQGVLRFVKYVSRRAEGDRWDLCGEWRVEEELDGDDDDDDDDAESAGEEDEEEDDGDQDEEEEEDE